MLTYQQIVERAATGGASAGKLELHKTSPEKALAWAEKAFSAAGRDLHTEIPNFESNFLIAKQHAIGGTLKRNEMPVITSQDVNGLTGVFKSHNVRVSRGKFPITKMRPMQFQIYVDKALNGIIKNGAAKTRSFLTGVTQFILSKDDYIMEGHHRFLTGILFDPTMTSKKFQVDLPRDELLAFLLAYTDRIGNTRNESKGGDDRDIL